jgi:hypothetical protein
MGTHLTMYGIIPRRDRILIVYYNNGHQSGWRSGGGVPSSFKPSAYTEVKLVVKVVRGLCTLRGRSSYLAGPPPK